jgi:hypothetical protein
VVLVSINSEVRGGEMRTKDKGERSKQSTGSSTVENKYFSWEGPRRQKEKLCIILWREMEGETRDDTSHVLH